MAIKVPALSTKTTALLKRARTVARPAGGRRTRGYYAPVVGRRSR